MLVIDLEKAKVTLNETWSEMLGSWTKTLLRYMYGKDVNMVANLNVVKEEEGHGPKFVIRGKYKDVKVYSKALSSEKSFLDAFREFGTDHPQTEKARTILRQDVKEFERVTGLIWPFKDED